MRQNVWAASLLLFFSGCGEPAVEPKTEQDQSIAAETTYLFSEQAAALGVGFVHFNGMAGDQHMAEITGAGGALFDFDRDGDLDLYLVQGSMLHPGKDVSQATTKPEHALPLTDRLYRNDLVKGKPETLHFTDVTTQSGIHSTGYGMGVAAADYDRDGWPDLYVANFGDNLLLRNNGDATFVDVTDAAGVADSNWSVASVFFDYDQDGWLDLFVGNYLDLSRDDTTVCYNVMGAQDYCGPENFQPQSDRLLRNRGNGTFEDASLAVGLTGGFGPALGSIAADFNGDRCPDLYVTNDAKPNNFWLNNCHGVFSDRALVAGSAINAMGKAEASMGVGAADFDADGDLDLFLTHLISETNTLYRNDGSGYFDDVTQGSGLGAASRLHTAFGLGWLDFDSDGWLDLIVANGAVKRIEALASAGDPFPFHEKNQLFRNDAGRRFSDVSLSAGPAFELSEVSRGLMSGDLDNDGDIDVVISNNNGPARVLIANTEQGPWLGVRLVAAESSSAAGPGTEIIIVRDTQAPIRHLVHTGGSYASSNDPRILFRLDRQSTTSTVIVKWADGLTEKWESIPLQQYTDLRQGSGDTVRP